MPFSLKSGDDPNKWMPTWSATRVLWHYTSIESLQHIANGKLKLSRFDLLNDPTEFADSKLFRFDDESQSSNGIDHINSFTIPLETIRRRGHIACFSSGRFGYAIAPMWAHYGRQINPATKRMEAYRGCCIGFDWDKLEELFKIAFGNAYKASPITYRPANQDNQISIDLSFQGDIYQAAEEFSRSQLWFTKHDSWQYENEVRFAVSGNEDEYICIDAKDAIVEIVAGVKAECDEIKSILKIGQSLKIEKENMVVCYWDRGNPLTFLLSAHMVGKCYSNVKVP